jgi:putative heme iron utilization protein
VADAEVARLAARAIAILLSEKGALQPSDEARLELLSDAFMSDRDETRRAIMDRMRQEGISAEESSTSFCRRSRARPVGAGWMTRSASRM